MGGEDGTEPITARCAAWISAVAIRYATAALAATASFGVVASEQPLFDSDEPLAIELSLPLNSLLRGRVGDESLAGTLSIDSRPDSKLLNVEVTTRGHSRKELCELPPLKLNFRRGELKETVFQGQNKLKLVTHCRDDRKFRRYLAHEHTLYRVYNLLSDASFRVRLLEITYIDTEGVRKPRARPAFFIEADGKLAQRIEMQEAALTKVSGSALNPNAITRLGLFQYMIGNTDWSLRRGRSGGTCCHNGVLLAEGQGYHQIVPYDFDQAGLVNADYALPARGLGIRSVRQRVFRGLCTGDTRLQDALGLFEEQRQAIYALFPLEGKMKYSNRRARAYLDDFYDLVAERDKFRAAIESQCRDNPSLWPSGDTAIARD
ncbi:MAG: hypothetical protein AAF098_20295 [Pseudomonadota bacterium]